MTNLATTLALASLLFTSSSFADNLTGHILSKGYDCNVVDVKTAVMVSSGGKKRMQIELDVQNLAYDKKITIIQQPSQRAQTANWDSSWWQYPVSAQFVSNFDGIDHLVIRDQRVGPENEAQFSVVVEMNENVYTCSDIRLGL